MSDTRIARTWDQIRKEYPKAHQDTVAFMVAEKMHETRDEVLSAMRRHQEARKK